MPALLKPLLPAALALSLLGNTSSARAAQSWDFTFKGNSFSQLNQPAPNIGVGLFIKGANDGSGTFTTPDGTSTGRVTIGDLGSGAGEAYPDFPTFQSLADNPATGTWTLNATTTAGSAQYHFTADFSQVSIPQVIITSPIQNTTLTNPRPTITWSTAGPGNIVIQVSNADFSVDYNQLLPQGQTSYTPPSDLPAGDYSVYIFDSIPTTAIPVTLTRMTGSDLNINPNGTFTFLSEAFTDFTVVVPEPSVLALLAPGLFLARRRYPR